MNFISFKTLKNLTTIILINSIVILTLINTVMGNQNINIVLGAIIFLSIVIVFNNIKVQNKIMAIIIFIIIYLIKPITIGNLSEFASSFSNNSGILSLFLVIPLLGKPLNFGKYSFELKKLFDTYFYEDGIFLLFTSFITYLLSLILNLASISIMFQITEERTKDLNKELLVRSILGGYLSAIYWSPNFVSVSIVLSFFNIKWTDMMKIGVVLSLLSLVFVNLHVIIGMIRNKDYQKKRCRQANKNDSIEWKTIIELIAVILIIVMVSIFSNVVLGINITIAVTLISLVLPFLWMIWLKKLKEYYDLFKQYFTKDVKNMSNEIVIFGCVGAMGHYLKEIDSIGVYVTKVMKFFNVSPIIFFVFIIYVIWSLSLISIHPLITLTIILNGVNLNQIGCEPIIFVFILLVGYGLSLIAAPFTGTALLVSNIIKEEPWTISFKLNWKLLTYYPLFITLIVLIIQQLFF